MRNINIRYFFVEDRVDEWEVIIESFSTDEMWGDLFAKTFKGSKFRRFR